VSDRSQPDKSLGRFHDRLRKWLYPKTAGVILQTEKAKYIYQKNIKKLNIKVIGNPIREILSQTDIQKQNQVLMVSRLIKSKHHDHLIKIFASINKKDWKLVLVGNDHLKQSNMESLKQLASDCGVADRVVFAGTQSDVEKYYLSSKIFAFTSSSEGFPNAIGEAMSAGLPVVAYDCIAGPSEMISDGENGYLVPVFDDIMFQEKLHKLMMDEALRKSMGENAKKSIRKFSVELIGKQFIDFILK
jgi:glycosyltransferase involved in cell wall biosynthesis